MIGWSETLNPNDPDFLNPFSIMIVGLLGAAVRLGAKALRNERWHRAFGNAVLELDPPGQLHLGRAVSDRLETEMPVAAMAASKGTDFQAEVIVPTDRPRGHSRLP